MKVHTDFGQYHKRFPHCPKEVPMSLLSERWAQRNHGQSLDQLNERGGMSAIELVCNIEGMDYPHGVAVNELSYIKKLIEYIELNEAAKSNQP